MAKFKDIRPFVNKNEWEEHPKERRKRMKIQIIAVGNEVVYGHTVNTNAAFIAKSVEAVGYRVTRHLAVLDQKEAIKEAITESMTKGKIICLIGGLGPTPDDLTKEVACEVLGQPLVCYPDVVESIEHYFEKMNRHMPKSTLKQAYFPEDCVILKNAHGTAPGCILTQGDYTLILLPGPPRELEPMLEHEVLPYLQKRTSKACQTKDIQVYGIGESEVAERLRDLLIESETLNIATYVGQQEVIVRIKVQAESQEACEACLEDYTQKIQERLGRAIIGYNGSKLEETVIACLQEKGYTIATAESCTGGMVASTLINCAGVSELIHESIVTYSNEAKEKYLGVQKATLQAYGAVSHQVAQEMAEGIRAASGAVIGLATTGIAGPGGGTKEKPVGLVYIGLALPEKTYTYQLNLVGTRQQVRERTTKNILYELYQLIQ